MPCLINEYVFKMIANTSNDKKSKMAYKKTEEKIKWVCEPRAECINKNTLIYKMKSEPVYI